MTYSQTTCSRLRFARGYAGAKSQPCGWFGILQAIDERAVAVVAFGIIWTPSSHHAAWLRQMERLAPPPEKHFAAMEQMARVGILTGTCLMPTLPDLPRRGTPTRTWRRSCAGRPLAGHGGRFVLAGGLTMADQQRDYFLGILDRRFCDLASRYRALYPVGSYGPTRSAWRPVALRVKELCKRYGIRDRMPRPIIPGDKRTLNKRIVEALANQCHWMELNNAPGQRVWAYRKVAWAIEDLQHNVGLVYRQMGPVRPRAWRGLKVWGPAWRG